VARHRSLVGVFLDFVLFAMFCLVAPAAWRMAAAEGRRRADRLRLAQAGYAMIGVGAALVAMVVPRAFGITGTYVIDPASTGLLLVLFLVGGWGLGRDIDLERGIESEQRRAEGLALDAERARVLALRAQLDPHFLFNALNAIAEWCREDPRVAEEATLKLASMMRMIHDGIGRPTWRLAEEVALLRRLVEIYEVRDKERYRFSLDVASPLPSADLPPMLTLPLIENAITHGPAAGHAGRVTVRVGARDGRVEVEVENPGAYAGPRPGGHGIAMVQQRLRLAYGEDASLSVRAVGDATIARVSIPLSPTVTESIAP